jgi:L-ascorbate metabolism protein UlaG (beta-lactamase superfamily)
VRISATPARHGPTGIEPLSGDVTGFVLSFSERHVPSIYITGDTVWYSGLAEVAHRFQPRVVLPFAGAAQTRGPFRLTMDSNDVVELAANFPNALIVPVHAEGWAHLTQGRDDLDHTFAALGLASRLRLLEPGRATAIFD